ncbi:MAG: hypothetical protein M3Q71_14220 [Chloroflexota bacterium]|nr:hypothetical protein [Chloroflexota bacterium]MDP9471795.1 hypothetical protein [Chloroflexota bacterium]
MLTRLQRWLLVPLAPNDAVVLAAVGLALVLTGRDGRDGWRDAYFLAAGIAYLVVAGVNVLPTRWSQTAARVNRWAAPVLRVAALGALGLLAYGHLA